MADRFHLLQNLTEVLELCFCDRRSTLSASGYSYGAIAQKTGVSVRTVQRYLKTTSFPERQPRCSSGRSLLLAPFQAFLQGTVPSVPPLRDRHLPPLTPRQAAFLVQSLSDSLSADEQQLLSLLSQQPDVAPAIELAQAFASLVRQRQHHLFDAWLQQAIDCSFSPLVRFCGGFSFSAHTTSGKLLSWLFLPGNLSANFPKMLPQRITSTFSDQGYYIPLSLTMYRFYLIASVHQNRVRTHLL